MEIFQLTFPDVEAAPEDLTVISWILPQTRNTKDENAVQKVYPRFAGQQLEIWARSLMWPCASTLSIHC